MRNLVRPTFHFDSRKYLLLISKKNPPNSNRNPNDITRANANANSADAVPLGDELELVPCISSHNYDIVEFVIRLI